MSTMGVAVAISLFCLFAVMIYAYLIHETLGEISDTLHNVQAELEFLNKEINNDHS